MIKVSERSHLYRDNTSGAIINKDRSAARVSREARAKALSDRTRIDKLENDLVDIKILLTQILEK